MPGSGGIISVACDERDAMCSLEHAYQAAAVENPEDVGDVLPPEVTPKTKKQLLGQGPQEEAASTGAMDGAPSPIA